MKIVLDTNVLVSGLLGLYSYPARIIEDKRGIKVVSPRVCYELICRRTD